MQCSVSDALRQAGAPHVVANLLGSRFTHRPDPDDLGEEPFHLGDRSLGIPGLLAVDVDVAVGSGRRAVGARLERDLHVPFGGQGGCLNLLEEPNAVILVEQTLLHSGLDLVDRVCLGAEAARHALIVAVDDVAFRRAAVLAGLERVRPVVLGTASHRHEHLHEESIRFLLFILGQLRVVDLLQEPVAFFGEDGPLLDGLLEAFTGLGLVEERDGLSDEDAVGVLKESFSIRASRYNLEMERADVRLLLGKPAPTNFLRDCRLVLARNLSRSDVLVEG